MSTGGTASCEIARLLQSNASGTRSRLSRKRRARVVVSHQSEVSATISDRKGKKGGKEKGKEEEEKRRQASGEGGKRCSPKETEVVELHHRPDLEQHSQSDDE